MPSSPAPAGADVDTLTIGPFDLSPQGEVADQVNELTEIPRPEGDRAIGSMTFRLADQNGHDVMPLDAHFHHRVVLDRDRTDGSAPLVGASRFGGPVRAVLGGSAENSRTSYRRSCTIPSTLEEPATDV